MYTEVHLLTIPISNCEQAVAEMNAFLRGHKIIAVTKEFVATGENSFYSERYLWNQGGFLGQSPKSLTKGSTSMYSP